MPKQKSLIQRLIELGRASENDPAYPTGMVEAARFAKERLKQTGAFDIEVDAQREINGRVSEFGKAA